jgi:hypothetical protein
MRRTHTLLVPLAGLGSKGVCTDRGGGVGVIRDHALHGVGHRAGRAISVTSIASR